MGTVESDSVNPWAKNPNQICECSEEGSFGEQFYQRKCSLKNSRIQNYNTLPLKAKSTTNVYKCHLGPTKLSAPPFKHTLRLTSSRSIVHESITTAPMNFSIHAQSTHSKYAGGSANHSSLVRGRMVFVSIQQRILGKYSSLPSLPEASMRVLTDL